MCPFFESLFVGFYTAIIYIITNKLLKNINNNFYIVLLICGFLKHYVSYYIGLHKFYCKYGYACNQNNTIENKNKLENFLLNFISKNNSIIIDSIFESLLFLILGILLEKFIENKIILFFVFGVILHLIAEYTRIHKLFCLIKCD